MSNEDFLEKAEELAENNSKYSELRSEIWRCATDYGWLGSYNVYEQLDYICKLIEDKSETVGKLNELAEEFGCPEAVDSLEFIRNRLGIFKAFKELLSWTPEDNEETQEIKRKMLLSLIGPKGEPLI